MDLIAIELLLWAALIFFFWVMKDGLGNIEDDIEALGFNAHRRQLAALKRFKYERPERAIEAIGNYMDAQIFRYVVIAGENYQFDHIVPKESMEIPQEGQCCVEPGLVYVRCDDLPETRNV